MKGTLQRPKLQRFPQSGSSQPNVQVHQRMDDLKKLETQEQEASSVTTLLKEFTEKTSMHGLRRVGSSAQHAASRYLWGLMVVGALGIASFNAIQVLVQFWDKPLSTTVTYEYADMAQFPAVSICNMNMLRRSQYARNTNLQGHIWRQYQPFPPPPRPDMSSFFDHQVNEDNRQVQESVQKYMSTIGYSERQELGHQLKDMLMQCRYQDTPCSWENFSAFYSQKLGNCFTFNKNSEAYPVTSTGPEHGLELTLHAEEEEYLSISFTTGFKIVVHPPNEMPFPEDEGIVVAPGFSTHIGITKVEIKRTPEPYGHCQTYHKNAEKRLNIYAELHNVTYSEKACYKTCYQYNMVSQCRCCHSSYPCPKVANMTICNKSNPDTQACFRSVSGSFFRGQLGCNTMCSQPCSQTMYTSETSTGVWPSMMAEPSAANMFREFLMNRNKDARNCDVRKNVAFVSVYFKTLSFQGVETFPAYNWSKFLGDLGGNFGLWIGVSFLTTVEVVVLLLDMCRLLALKVHVIRDTKPLHEVKVGCIQPYK